MQSISTCNNNNNNNNNDDDDDDDDKDRIERRSSRILQSPHCATASLA